MAKNRDMHNILFPNSELPISYLCFKYEELFLGVKQLVSSTLEVFLAHIRVVHTHRCLKLLGKVDSHSKQSTLHLKAGYFTLKKVQCFS